MRHSRHRSVVTSAEPVEHRAAFPQRPVFDWSRVFGLPPWVRPRPATLGLAAVALATRARIVHAHFGYALPQVAGVVRRLGLPLVLSLHGQDVTSLPRQHPAHYAGLLELPAVFVVPSRWLAERAAELGVPQDRLHVIGSGIDNKLWRPSSLPQGPPTVAFVGRLVEKKGLDVLLAAWPQVRDRVPEARLEIVGDGPLRPLLDSAPPGVTHHLPDPTDPAGQARSLVARSSVVTTPSRTAADGDAESLLLVNLEAQAAGRPVVTTRHGGIPEYVEEGGSALIVPENDPRALAEALVRVLTDRPLADRLAARGPQVAAAHDVRRTAARLDDLYDALLPVRGTRWPSTTR